MPAAWPSTPRRSTAWIGMSGAFWTRERKRALRTTPGFCSGRKKAVTRKGDGLEVLLGPVEITEVIKDADLQADQPIDLDNALVYTAPDYPGAANHPDESAPTSLAEPMVPAFFASYTPPLAHQSPSVTGPG